MKTFDSLNNILIIKPGAIGDLLQLTPVLRALKNRLPDSQISLLVGSSVTAQLFKYNECVNETIVFEKKGKHKTLLSLIRLWKVLSRKKYDLVINFQRSNLKTWFLASAAFPCPILVYHKSKSRNIHVVANYLETVAPLGILADTADVKLELSVGPEESSFAEKVFSQFARNDKPLIALNPGASHKVNRWSARRFASLADMLARNLSARVMLIGGKEDIPLAEEITAQTGIKPLVMTGKADLLELAALLGRCDLLVSGDTGPLHLATAVGTRVIALFGPADPARTGPIGAAHRVIQPTGVRCVPCRRRTCGNKNYLECMEQLSPDEVFEAAREMLNSK